MSTKKTRSEKNHYVNNKQLLEEMINYRNKVIAAKEAGTRKPQVTNYIGQCLMLIAQRVAHKPCFSNYSYREEMISDGIENCIMYIDNFDPGKSSNPFAYFTQIIHFAFIRRIQKEKKQQYIKIKNMQNSFLFSELEEHLHSDGEMGGTQTSVLDNEITSSFIRSFEESMEKKKKAAQTPKQGVEMFIEEVDSSESV